MKKTILRLLSLFFAVTLFPSCENDDSSFSNYTLVTDSSDDDDDDVPWDTIYIVYDGTVATVANDIHGYVTASGAHVTVSATQSTSGMLLVLSGSTPDGSLTVFRSRKYSILLNDVSITNGSGPAINNQCSKSLIVCCTPGTASVLADGATYAQRDYDQKATLFSEGQLYFRGTGTLTVHANSRNAIASDDYITFDDSTHVDIVVSPTGTNGLKANDGVFIHDGTLFIDVASPGGRGIRSEARTLISGGTVTVNTTGDCKIETVDGVADTSSAACIKSDSLFSMAGGVLTLTSSGDGGKGIRCQENIEISGGVLVAKTTGENNNSKPKALKSDTGIIIRGGSLTATVRKSWACDNGSESEDPRDHITVSGTPALSTITKKSVIISFD